MRAVLIALSLAPVAMAADAPVPQRAFVRIKDIARIKGVRENPLLGHGLVMGLAGTGDGANTVTSTLYQNLLKEMHNVALAEVVKPKNVAAVEVTAVLPPYAAEGDHVDVVVSAMADAGSIAGGQLIMAPLKGADGVVYAVACGSVTNVGGANQSKTVGRIPGGATIECEPQAPAIVENGQLIVSLRRADFSTASSVAKSINRDRERLLGLGAGEEVDRLAWPRDARSIVIQVPERFRQEERIVDFVSRIEGLPVDAVDVEATVFVDSRTKGIGISGEVTVDPCVVALPGIQITVPPPRDPEPYKTTVAGIRTVPGTRLSDLLADLRDMKVDPDGLIAVIQAIDKIGKLHGRIVTE